MSFSVVWGIDGIDRSMTSEDSIDLGEPVYRESFDIASVATQQHIFDTCNAIVAQSSELQIDPAEAKCFMSAFAEWRVARQQAFPVPPEQFKDAIREFLGRPQFGYTYVAQVCFHSNL